MLTERQIRACYPLSGAYPVSLLRAYYGLVLKEAGLIDRELTNEDIHQITNWWTKEHTRRTENFNAVTGSQLRG